MPARRKVEYIQGDSGATPIHIGVAEDRERHKLRVKNYLVTTVPVPNRRIKKAITPTQLKTKMMMKQSCWRAKYKLIRHFYHAVGDNVHRSRDLERKARLPIEAAHDDDGNLDQRTLERAMKKANIAKRKTARMIIKRYKSNGFKLRVSANIMHLF